MDNIAGPPVEGDNFFGREAVVDYFRDELKNNDILLLGPRRIGKTSVARAVMVAVREQGWQTIEINVASCRNEHDFLKKLERTLSSEVSSLPTKIRNTLAKKLSEIGERTQSVKVSGVEVSLNKQEPEEWTIIACDLLQLIAQVKGHWLLYMDELPIMLYNIIRDDSQQGIQRVRRFLDWFRNDVRALPGADKVRWLVSGSVGLDTLVQEHGMADTINSLSHEGLEPFSEQVASDMLSKLADRDGINLSDDDKQAMIAAVQWPQPYYLQIVFNHLRALILADTTNSSLSTLIQQALNKMIQPGADNDFHHWEGRLSQQLSRTDADHARVLLNHAAHDAAGARAEMLLNTLQERMSNHTTEEAKRTFVRLRDILLRDAYWQINATTEERRYQFRLEPLRRWWLRRNAL
ncbi:MAG: ATP-binding protein [Gammaproteobacteria bacterium]|nr:ATP-binding protein [Gammaproteobacteria bacterium]MCF6230848.1 ATP-binding protein [Gammaproteobacteria bacterium]